MTLADIQFDDFLEWLEALENMDDQTQEDLQEAARNVPFLGKLIMTHANAMRQGAPDQNLQRSSAIINALVAAHFILEGRTKPGLPGPE